MKANEAIEAYLKDYLGRSDPSYAVMLTGGWGCGKTHFMSKYIKQYDAPAERKLDAQYQSSFLKISAFGTKDEQELDAKLFFALHPKWQGEYSELFTHLAHGILSFTQTDALVGKFRYKDFLHALKNRKTGCQRIIVIDDFERSNIPPTRRLAYVNSLVELQGLHVIILSNDEEIDVEPTVATAPDQKNSYRRIREKVIGKTLKIQTEIEDVLDMWFPTELPKDGREVVGSVCRKMLAAQKKTIAEVMNKSATRNFRAMKHCFLDFERFLSALNKERLENNDFLIALVRSFLAHQYEVHIGSLIIDDVCAEDPKAYAAKMKAYGEQRKQNSGVAEFPKTAYEKFKQRQNLQGSVVFKESIWNKWLSDGWVEPSLLAEEISKLAYFNKSDLIKQLGVYYQMNDVDALQLMNSLDSELEMNTFVDQGSILFICDCFMKLSSMKVLALSPAEQLNRFTEYVDRNMSRIEYSGYNEPEQYMADAQSKDVPEFLAFIDFMKQVNEKIGLERSPEIAEDLVDQITRNVDEASRIIRNRDGKLSTNAMLKVNPSKFVEALIAINVAQMNQIRDSLESRYPNSMFVKRLTGEIEFLKNVVHVIEKKLAESEKPLPPSIMRLIYVKNTIETILTRFNNDTKSVENLGGE